ncbi:hypothetical protein ACSNOK_20890 [Streptomyces sp. URMC 126]|uniref:hypothetical protein n=1 Tax=Streptomyces sp. URMC 126 TaxID=3423401 RepID=UPI003F1D9E13
MTETILVRLAANGVVVEEAAVAPSGVYPYWLLVSRKGKPDVEYEASTLFACLIKARQDWESEGLLACCQGARRNITTSGLESQMTGGRFAYVFDPVSDTVDPEPVDIFDAVSPEQAATVADQRAAVFRFFRLVDPENRGKAAAADD